MLGNDSGRQRSRTWLPHRGPSQVGRAQGAGSAATLAAESDTYRHLKNTHERRVEVFKREKGQGRKNRELKRKASG